MPRLIALLVLLLIFSRSWAAPQVVASIGPIHSLTAAVMEGVAEPRRLIPAGASPHTYSLLPSDARALRGADLVVWVGPTLESFLVKPLQELARDARVLQLSELEGLTLLEPRELDEWAHEHTEDDHGHENNIDPHLWLDPLNAIRIGEAVAEALIAVDPSRTDTYRRNAGQLKQRLLKLHQEIEAAVKPVRQQPFVVFHDAYHYFEHRYGLHAAAAITVSPDQRPGVRRLAEIRSRIEKLDARCVFREPQFEPALVRTVVEGTGARVGTLDPEGAELEPGPDAYFKLMRELTKNLVKCLQ